MPELRSKKQHDKLRRDDVDVTEMRSKKVHDKGGCNDFQHVKPSGEGMVDVVLRHQCMLEAVCSLNIKLEEVQKSALEGTM